MIRNVLAVACLIALVAPAMAAPLNFTENWDSYTAGAAPPSPWYTDPHMPDGSNLLTGTSARVKSAPNAYQVNDGTTAALDKGDQAMLVGVGEWVEATDDAPLKALYTAKAQTNNRADWYFELSLGDEHAPNYQQWVADGSVPLATPLPVVAYCKPFTGATSKTCYYFDGVKWGGAGYFDNNTIPEDFSIVVKSTAMALTTSKGTEAGIPYNLSRMYTGSFDRVSIYTLNNTVATWATIDDIAITGGNVVPEPATVMALVLGTVLLRRRRS